MTIAVLGATGSIGRQTLEVATEAADPIRVLGLSAGSDLAGLCSAARAHRPLFLALERAADPAGARAQLAAASPSAEIRVGPGSAAWLAGACRASVVVNGIVGAAGLAASLAALESGARLALANKETLVVGGPLVARLLRGGARIFPVDSEHWAAWQCVGGRRVIPDVARLTLTASGGALRRHTDWRHATRDEVLAHPVWSMGRRITVDSALLFNKGLELIEAHVLFDDFPWEKLDAVLHPQALVHAMVTFTDGSMMLQAAPPDMKIPIRAAIAWPGRRANPNPNLKATDLAGLTFEPIPAGRYPALDIALEAGRAGGTAPCVLNAADEIAVEAFLDGAITLGQVPEIVRRVVEAHTPEPVESLAQLDAIDAVARRAARESVVRA